MIGTKADILTYACNNKNFDVTNYIKDSYIKAAELQHIKPILGEDFYNDIDTNPSGYSTLLTTYLKEVIAFYSYYESIPYIQLSVGNQGLMIGNSQTATAVTDKQRADFRDNILSQANTLRDEMISYIEDNTDTYTLYLASENISKTTKLIGGIIF